MRKKIMLLMCMAALLVAFFSLGVVGANQVPPEVTVVAARVDNGAALELGLRIDSKNDSFQSTGVVLEYDASALKPCGWADEVTDELLEKAKVDPTALAEGETMWDHAVPLPTKGKDIISGKTAFTVIDSTTNKGYLYLSVEAPIPTNVPVQAPAPLYGLNQVQPSEMGLEGLEELTAGNGFQSNHGVIDATSAVDQVITVRFALPTETPEPPVEPPVEPTPDPEEPNPGPTPDPNPDETDEPSAQADETEGGNGEGSGEGGGEPTEPEPTDPTEPDPDTPENPDDPPAETAEDFMAKYGIKVAEDATAVNSPAGRSGIYFYTTDTEPVDILNWHFLSVKNGISVNSGSGGPPDPSDFAAIVFYDWDETILGAVIVPKGDATKYVDDFTNARIADPSELDSKYLWYSNDKIAADEADPERTPKYLSNKKAYDFDTWLLNDSDTFTAQDTALPKYDGTDDAAAAAAGVANFGEVTGDMVVKASYKANETINKLDNGRTSNSYVISEPTYYRYGASASNTAGTYSLKATLVRENTDGYGVTRVREPALRAMMTSDTSPSAAIYVLSYLDKTDRAELEVVPAKPIKSVTFGLIEMYETSNWPGAGARSNLLTKNKNTGGVIGTDGFVKFGTLALINEQARIQGTGAGGGNWGWINAQAFTDSGLDISKCAGANAAQRANAAKALLVAYFSANPTASDLTFDQMQKVINSEPL